MAQGFKATVKPQHERKQFIADQATASKNMYTSYEVYEGKATSLPIIQLPITFPLYRMANGRTETEQLAVAADKGLAKDYFINSQENDTAQQLQHDILRIFAREGTDSIKPIIEELERTKQTEPLLITPTGVVVNGNRRLSAMRELYYSDRQAEFATFQNIDCAVLPPLSDDQVEEIEVRLQMRPETKLPYGWINECRKIQKLMTAGRKEDEVARLMNKRPGDVKKAISALKYAEIYLKDWLKKPQDYKSVAAGEQFFHDLTTRFKNKDGELLEANMRMAWMLFDNRLNLGSRIYDFNKVLGEKAPEVLTKLAERIDVDLAPAAETGDGERLDIDLGESPTAGPGYDPLIKALDDPGKRDEIADALRAVCQTIIDAGRTAKEGRSALAAVQDANTRLTEVDLTKADPSTYDGIDRQLEEIVRRATDLKARLQPYRASAIILPKAANEG